MGIQTINGKYGPNSYCRREVSFDKTGRRPKTYTKGHVPRAVFIDLKEDLSRNPEVHGGRHPLQDPDLLAAKLGKIGIDRQTDVIVYDDSGGMFAARFWWQLHYLGHDSVYIMDGGLSNWIKAGYEMTAEVPRPSEREFKPALRENELLDAGERTEANRQRKLHPDRCA